MLEVLSANIAISYVYYVASVVVGIVVTFVCNRRFKPCSEHLVSLFLLVSYVSFVLCSTVISRSVGTSRQFQLHLFWSYEIDAMTWEIILNVIMLVPVGFFVSRIWNLKWWIVVLMCASFSLSIELMQLLGKRGLFEYDDILHNSLGGLIGVCADKVLRWIGKKS